MGTFEDNFETEDEARHGASVADRIRAAKMKAEPDPRPHGADEFQVPPEPPLRRPVAGVVGVWEHPQGGRITVYEDGTMDARNAAGKKKSTSATPEKLLAGHGAWKRVQ